MASIKVTKPRQWKQSLSNDSTLHLSTPQQTVRLSLPRRDSGDLLIHDTSKTGLRLLAAADNSRDSYDLSVLGCPKASRLRRSGHKRWSFDVRSTNGRVDKFEWRVSHYDEVRKLGGSRIGTNLKLVWLGSRSTVGQSHWERMHPKTYSKDGGEIVAVWVSKGHKSLSEVGDIRFLGSGVTGELGDGWAVIATLSCMCVVWQSHMKQQNGDMKSAVL